MNRRAFGWMGIAAISLTISLLLGSGRSWVQPAISSDSVILAQTSANEAADPAEPTLAVSGIYTDPQGAFQIGILDGVITTTAGGAPLFTLPDGSLAYSLVQMPLDSDAPLSDVALVALANQALDNGEGFQTQTFTSVPQGLQIEWTGRLSQGGAPPQPVGGSILAKQQGASVYLLVVAALEDFTAQVPSTLTTLADSLQLL